MSLGPEPLRKNHGWRPAPSNLVKWWAWIYSFLLGLAVHLHLLEQNHGFCLEELMADLSWKLLCLLVKLYSRNLNSSSLNLWWEQQALQKCLHLWLHRKKDRSLQLEFALWCGGQCRLPSVWAWRSGAWNSTSKSSLTYTHTKNWRNRPTKKPESTLLNLTPRATKCRQSNARK